MKGDSSNKLLSIQCEAFGLANLKQYYKNIEISPVTTLIPVNADITRLKLKVGVRWIDLRKSQKLLIFFNEILKSPEGAKSKNLVESLWPGETHMPNVHSARLTDLAKRGRKLLKDEGQYFLNIISNGGVFALTIDEG